MAAFSYQHPPFLLDSVFLPTTPMKMSGFMGEEGNNITTTTTGFSQFFPSGSLHEVPPAHDQSRFLQHSSKVAALSDNEPCVTQKLSTDSSSVVDRLELGEQVTQKVAPMEKKRKSRDGSSLTSAQSKVKKKKDPFEKSSWLSSNFSYFSHFDLNLLIDLEVLPWFVY